MNLPRILTGIVAAGACLPASAVPLYVIFDLGTLGGISSTASDINNRGQIVGTSDTAGGGQHAFLYSHGVGLSDLGTLGGPSSSASRINDRGHMVGMSETADGKHHGYLYTPRRGMTDLNVRLGAPDITVSALNNPGQIVGSAPSGGSLGSRVAYIYTPGVGFTYLSGPFANAVAINNRGEVAINNGRPPIGPLGGPGLFTDLNDAGQLVGFGTSATSLGRNRAFLVTPGVGAIDLGTLGGQESAAAGINSGGMVVGSSETSGGAQHAFVYVPGEGMFDLNTLTTAPDWVLTSASAINDQRMIAGTGLYKGQTHAFLAIDPPAGGSTPEPGTWAVCGTGLLGLWLSQRTRGKRPPQQTRAGLQKSAGLRYRERRHEYS